MGPSIYITSLDLEGAPLLLKRILETMSAFYSGCKLELCANHLRVASHFMLSAVLRFHVYTIWLRIKVMFRQFSCGVSLQCNLLMQEMVFKVSDENRRSIQFLLGSGDEGEEADNDVVDCLA